MKKFIPLIGIVAIIVIWLVVDFSHIFRPLFWPSFFSVLKSIFDSFIISGDGWVQVGPTLYRTLFGFVLAGIFAVPLGIMIGASRVVYSATEMVIDFFRSLPVIAIFPLFLLVFGLGDTAKIALAVFFSFWVILVNSIYGVWHSSALRKTVGKVFGANKFQLLKEIIFPDALPHVFVGLRIALSFSLLVVVASEMFIGTNYGIGQKIFNSYMTFRTPDLYAYIIIAGMLGYALNKIFYIFERRVVHWSGK